MALIPCPECGEEASDRAVACPHCGFPIADEMDRLLSEVTGHDRIRSARQRAAATKLKDWSERYEEHARHPVDPNVGFVERHQRLIVGAIVLLIVAVQLFVLFRAAYH